MIRLTRSVHLSPIDESIGLMEAGFQSYLKKFALSFKSSSKTFSNNLIRSRIQANCYSTCSNEDKKTALYDLHLKKSGKMVVFADHLMPIYYKDKTIVESHLHTRSAASIFDVSHMLQTIVSGKDRVEFMESITVADVTNLPVNQSTLSLFTNEKGGIVDDLIITKVDKDYLYVVSNAGCIEKDKKLMETKLAEFKGKSKNVELRYLNDEYSLIALQGPKSAESLQKLVNYDLRTQYFMHSKLSKILDSEVRITRCGYTGEDGFEISVKNEKVHDLVDCLLKNSNVALAGLGARDSLRVEAGLCLYGNDIDENTTPVEASLLWTISQTKRSVSNATYPGANKILGQISKQIPIERKRVGLKSLSGPPARQGIEIQSNDKTVGQITSGCPSPVLKQNIAIGYIDSKLAKTGNRVLCKIRNKLYEYEVTKMPFVQTNYYMAPKK